jgi:hypothetical protein
VKKKNLFIYLIIAALAVGCTRPTDSKKSADVNATVKGTVLTPLEEAIVYVYEAGMDLRGPPLATIKTSDLKGEYKIDLPAGKYFFVARKRVSKESIGLVTTGDYKSEIAGPIEITKSGEINLDLIALRKLGDVKENIVTDVKMDTSFSGTIYNSEGDPAAEVRVHVYDHIQMSERPKFVSDKTGPDGKYKLYLPEGGTYYICARDRFGGPPKVGDLYGRYDQGTIDPSAIMIKTGEDLTGIDITAHKVW